MKPCRTIHSVYLITMLLVNTWLEEYRRSQKIINTYVYSSVRSSVIFIFSSFFFFDFDWRRLKDLHSIGLFISFLISTTFRLYWKEKVSCVHLLSVSISLSLSVSDTHWLTISMSIVNYSFVGARDRFDGLVQLKISHENISKTSRERVEK
jgi:hypothetical protein